MEAAIDLQVCREQSFKFLDLFWQQVATFLRRNVGSAPSIVTTKLVNIDVQNLGFEIIPFYCRKVPSSSKSTSSFVFDKNCPILQDD